MATKAVTTVENSPTKTVTIKPPKFGRAVFEIAGNDVLARGCVLGNGVGEEA